MLRPRDPARDDGGEEMAEPTDGPAARAAVPLRGQRGIDPVGRALVRRGLLGSRSLFEAEARVQRAEVRLPDALRLAFAVPEEDIAAAVAEVARTRLIDPLVRPPDPALIRRVGAAACARLGVLPWRRAGGSTVVLTSRPDEIVRHEAELAAALGPISVAVATERQITAALQRHAARDLAAAAEVRLDEGLSSRGWQRSGALWLFVGLVFGVAAAFAAAPRATFFVLAVWAVATLALSTALKVAAFAAVLRQPRGGSPKATALPLRLPTVTILVPLYREKAIAAHLLARLQALDYPQELLDICLILEQDDVLTRATIAGTELPPWIRTFTVPRGSVKTKPRALNYALDFARGSIVGVYDAEDAPAPDQIRKVVARFAAAPPQVACLQGILDYYNSRANWLARCFTLEYATWFRIMLPGLARMELVVPLGGTTLFFRRAVLEELGGWDAHNVTEDADLGLRLARAGYRTELLHTVTEEEANCRPWPWIKQRSRWLKGYAITYGVHMRRPLRLLRELGWWRFAGVQVLFAGTLSQFVLAPVLWSFWSFPLGLTHPLEGVFGMPVIIVLGTLFVASELVNVAVAAVAVQRAGKPALMVWAPTLHAYFPLAAVACYRGLAELAFRPFYWDKTDHGLFLPGRNGTGTARPGRAAATPPPPPTPRQDEAG